VGTEVGGGGLDVDGVEGKRFISLIYYQFTNKVYEDVEVT